ncbi:MAG: flagellar brake domain-containing protein [Candidatus Latescibacteria bacterium]|nr:flagellar brake domain-containing protein [Candidatus Latescibacterota bacterium]
MKTAIQIKIMEQVQLVVSDGPQAGIYSTRVEDLSEAHIVVDAPVSGRDVIFLEEALPLWVTFAREHDARYRFRSKVIGRTTTPIPTISIARPKKIERTQDREFVRVPAMLPARCVFVKKKDEEIPDPFKASIVDISAGGIRMEIDRPLRETRTDWTIAGGTYLSVTFDLPGLMRFDQTEVRVINVIENRWERPVLLCMFLDITEGMREQIVRYNLSQQRVLLRKGLL